MSEPKEGFDQWAIVDVMGHQRYIGRVTEEVIAGCGFVRVDIPKTDEQPAWTKLIGTASIYAITPVEKDIAIAMSKRSNQSPVSAYELTPKMIAATSQREMEFDEDDDDEPF